MKKELKEQGNKQQEYKHDDGEVLYIHVKIQSIKVIIDFSTNRIKGMGLLHLHLRN